MGRFGILLAVTLAAALAGCMASVHGAFDPVQGPLAEQRPPPAFAAVFFGAPSGGRVEVTLGGGERFAGPWKLVDRGTAAGIAARESEPGENLSAAWDFVYGEGYYRAHVLGAALFTRALLTGSAGSSATVEFVNETNERGHTRAVARDSHGNVFKVSVYN